MSSSTRLRDAPLGDRRRAAGAARPTVDSRLRHGSRARPRSSPARSAPGTAARPGTTDPARVWRGPGRTARSGRSMPRSVRGAMVPPSAGRKPRDDVEQRRLAGAVGADEPEDLARRTRNDTSSSAVTPPKRFDTSLTSSVVVRWTVAGDGLGGRARRRSVPRRADVASSARTLEEHRSQHVGPLEQLGGRAVEPDLALLHEVRRLGDGERDVHRLLDEDDRGALARGARARCRAAGATTVGARPSDSSSIMSRRGWPMNAMPEREHLLLAAGQVAGRLVEPLAQDGEVAPAHARSPRDMRLSLRRCSQPASRRFSAHGQRREHALAAGHLVTPRRRGLVGRRVGHVAAVEDDRAAARPRRVPRSP